MAYILRSYPLGMLHGWIPPCTTHTEPAEIAMPLLNVVVTLIVVGVLLWLVNSYIPMDAKIKKILNIVVVVAVVLWLLSAFGLIGNLGNIRVGQG